LDLHLHVESVSLTTFVSSNPVHVDVYSTQQYMIKFVSDYLRVFRLPPPIKMFPTI